ncbi:MULTISPECIES: hypothetical protein [unclassified Streptomyces]|uniref:hypothetical protein n=1 Tax=unclassified Streptomyces TaxID=2593676 RepID=UPI0036EB698E
MEQRIDPKTQPGYAAGTDPAYIPGLTAPVTAGKADTERELTDEEQTEERAPGAVALDDAVAEAVPEDAVPEEAAAGGEAAAEAAADDEEAADDDEEAEKGPVFEVSDRRGSITVDRDGVLFRLDDQEAEFLWDEIGAVEVKTPRIGRRFTVTVHLSTRRWFNAEVEAPARSNIKEWADELDAVLDVYFEA